MAQIRLDVRITYRGRSVNAVALHDTGAETYAFIDNSIASQLGLPRGSSVAYSGIAGASVGFQSQVDNLTLLQNSQCSVNSVPVVVGQVTVPNVQLLVGEYFMRSAGMQTLVDENGIKISCKGGPLQAISQPIPTEYWVIGGAIVIAAALFVYLLSD